jgi:hypothetical protein
VKQSFRNYINGFAQGTVAFAGGAGLVDGIYGFPVASNNLDTADVSVVFAGAINFNGHKGALDLTLANPKVEFSTATTGTLYLDARVNAYNSNPAVDEKNVEFATFSYTKTGTGEDAVYAATDVKLTADGAKAFAGFYGEGEALDDFVLSSENVTIPVVDEPFTVTGSLAVAGTAKVGVQLTAPSLNWGTTGVDVKYQWLSNGTVISGATSATYTAVAADQGKKLSVRLTGSKSGYTTLAVTSNQTAAVALADAPKATTKPSVTGTAKVDSTLTAKPGTWNVSGVAVKYQWLANGSVITGATSTTYKVKTADSGKKISVRVTASKAGYSNGVETSATVTASLADAPKTIKVPTVSGKATFNSKLTVKSGTWNASGLKYNYQWLRDGKAIKGATKTSYTVKSADVGKKLSVKVTATKTGYKNGTANTAATKKVVKATPNVVAKVKKSTIKRSQKTTVTVTVKSAGVAKPVGKVTVKVGKKSFTKTLKASNKGKVTITVRNLNKGKNQKVTAKFTPSGSTKKVLNTKTSTAKQKLTVR